MMVIIITAVQHAIFLGLISWENCHRLYTTFWWEKEFLVEGSDPDDYTFNSDQ